MARQGLREMGSLAHKEKRVMRSARIAAWLLLCGVTAAAQQAPPSGPSNARIEVRGHWTFDIRNPDGSGAARYEFDNELIDARPLLLTLSRTNSAAYWNVGIGDVFGDGEPCLSGTPAVPAVCSLQEPGDAVNFSGAKKLSVLNVSTDGAANGALVLQGTFTAEKAGQISSVTTGMSVCASTVAPATPCSFGNSFFFTRHHTQPTGAPSAGGPIPFNAGQIVQVRVEIRFSPSTGS
jgi:hypothetical protein